MLFASLLGLELELGELDHRGRALSLEHGLLLKDRLVELSCSELLFALFKLQLDAGLCGGDGLHGLLLVDAELELVELGGARHPLHCGQSKHLGEELFVELSGLEFPVSLDLLEL